MVLGTVGKKAIEHHTDHFDRLQQLSASDDGLSSRASGFDVVAGTRWMWRAR